MAIPPHSKPRHKKAPNKRSIIRWCVGTAMLTATALIISIPLDHARRRQHPTSSQRQSVRSHHHQHRKQGNPRKQTAGENSTTRASQTKPATKQTTNPQRKIPTNTIGNSSSHPATSWQPSTTRNSASAYPYATEQANRRSPSAQGIGKAHPCQSGEREPIPSSPHTGASPTNSCSPNSTKPREGDEFTITTLGENPHLSSANNPHHHPRRFHLDKQTRRQRRSGHPYDLHPIRHQHPPASHHRNARPQPRRMPARNRMPHRRNPLHHGIRAHSHLGDPHHTRTA